jgi:hypothetical protein
MADRWAASYKVDPLSDERLGKVDIGQLRAFLAQQGAPAADCDACGTKFALVTLAEDRKIALEPLLVQAAKPPVSVAPPAKVDKPKKGRVSSAMESVGTMFKHKARRADEPHRDAPKKGKGKKGAKASPKLSSAPDAQMPEASTAANAARDAAVLAAYAAVPPPEAEAIREALSASGTGQTDAEATTASASVDGGATAANAGSTKEAESASAAQPAAVAPKAATEATARASTTVTLVLELRTAEGPFPFQLNLRGA